MLSTIRIRNFRCFSDHTVTFKHTTVMVGTNNSGKSSIVEALQIVSVVIDFFYTSYRIRFHYPSKTSNIEQGHRGFRVPLKGKGFVFDTMFNHYSNPPAIIDAFFRTNEIITIYIYKKNWAFVRIRDANGTPVTTDLRSENLKLPSIKVLPQLTAITTEERIVFHGDVSDGMSSTKFSTLFRNQLNLYHSYFEKFKENVETTWSGLRIREFDGKGHWPDKNKLNLFVQEKDFVAEVAWMGNGLQVWLQVIWFLTMTEEDDIIVLDEPDVYMHPDLQHKLIRMLQNRNQQFLITTHAVEIMSDFEPDQIVIIDKRRKKSSFTSSIQGVQEIIDRIGGVYNLQLARLGSSRRCLFVEGKDIRILKYIQSTLFPDSKYPLHLIPHIDIGGWSGWNYTIGSSIFLKNAGGENIMIYCILDSDYHTPKQIKERIKDASRRGVQLHIWKKKEIENYLLSPLAIQRIISSQIAKGSAKPTIKEITNQIDLLVNDLKDSVFDSISNEYFLINRAGGLPKANEFTRKIIKKAWTNRKSRWGIVSGKKVLSKLSNWSNEKYGISFSPNSIARELKIDEIERELIDFIRKIERLEMIDSNFRTQL